MVQSEGRARGEGSAAGTSVGGGAAFREEREGGVNRMPRNIEGSVVVVMGASSGIGRVTARLFAANGARVVLAPAVTRFVASIFTIFTVSGFLTQAYMKIK
jgi:NADPH:quinone reductase-like Zn-dependent oxidoreductase